VVVHPLKESPASLLCFSSLLRLLFESFLVWHRFPDPLIIDDYWVGCCCAQQVDSSIIIIVIVIIIIILLILLILVCARRQTHMQKKDNKKEREDLYKPHLLFALWHCTLLLVC